MPSSLSAAAKGNVQAALDKCTDPKSSSGVPGLVFAAVDRSGTYLTQNVSGFRGGPNGPLGKQPMTIDSVFWIASCTKLITSIAALQLVEQGKLSLDDAESLYKICPELKDKQVIDESGKLVPRTADITLRMLLTHTAGFGYTFFNERLRDFYRPMGLDELTGDGRDVLEMPLVNQPGSRWEYGINIDWAGIAVERVSGMNLDAYFKKNIFEPLGIENITFFPSKHMREQLVGTLQRLPDGSIDDIDHAYRRAVLHADDPTGHVDCAGGAGCFAKPAEYCLILAALLNDGESPNTGKRILSKETVEMMFQNQIPQFPDFGRQSIPASKPRWTNPLPELYPQQGNPSQGWGLSFMSTIEPGPTGRGANTGWWAGIVNLFWWCDREKGVAGIIAAQVLPFGDGNVLGAWGAAEAAIYAGLEG